MKRWTFRVLVCLVLGAITTVAVAWGAAVSMRTKPDHREWFQGDITYNRPTTGFATNVIGIKKTAFIRVQTLMPSRLDGAAAVAYRQQYLEHGAPRWTLDVLMRLERMHPDRSSMADVAIEGYGWPASAFWCGWQRSEAWLPKWIRWSPGIRTPIESRRMPVDQPHVILPTQPIWSGLFINTIFYALIWFGLLFGFTTTRRAIRKRRGRCPRCGYDLRGDTPHPQPLSQGERGGRGCPECGWNRDNGVSTPPV